MFGNTPMLCGGSQIDTCISFQSSQWSQSHSMTEKRDFAAGVQINSTTFWILGGEGGEYIYDGILHTTEFIIQGETKGVPGPNLPTFLTRICAVKLSETEIFVIGGLGGDDTIYDIASTRNEVWIYNPQNGFSRKQGPSLSTPRYGHSCSTMRDGEKTLIVTAGGYISDDFQLSILPSVEIYDPIDNTWYPGKKFPSPKINLK